MFHIFIDGYGFYAIVWILRWNNIYIYIYIYIYILSAIWKFCGFTINEIMHLWFFSFSQIIFFGFLNNVSLSLSPFFFIIFFSPLWLLSLQNNVWTKNIFVIVPADLAIIFGFRENVSNNKVMLNSEFVSW